ncbi:HNH endonuclease [uncultured Cyclobacterium sp.]|uniref:HNH endonuclease n=1 Tax=uncultured Cyclobacterium sp. TaxID=453820 RepID=UPI0030EBB97C
MEKKVLVLNLDHSPIGVVNVYKAFVLTYLDKATALVQYDNLQIRTVDKVYDYPAVIRLDDYKNIPYKGVLLNRNNLFKRDDHTCQYCGSSKNLTLDHVIPKSKGGKTSWSNLITACHRCNTIKGNKTPEEAGMALKIYPFKPNLSYFLAEYAERHAEEWIPFLAIKQV